MCDFFLLIIQFSLVCCYSLNSHFKEDSMRPYRICLHSFKTVVAAILRFKEHNSATDKSYTSNYTVFLVG